MAERMFGVMKKWRRVVYVLFVWSTLCYGLFLFSGNGQSSEYVGANVNTRLLLQKVTETPPSTPSSTQTSTPSSPTSPSAAAAVDAVDNAPKANQSKEAELTPLIARKIPNIPFEFWLKEKSKIYTKNHTCAFYPNVFDIKFNNNYWQTFRSSNGTFYLYGAYHDNRAAVGRPTMRILAMIDRIEPTVKTHCLLWFSASKDPVVTPVVEYKYIWSKKWGNYKQGVLQPYLISCQLPTKGVWSHRVPISVSMTEKGCEPATNNLRVNNDLPPQGKKGRFAVCVKGLDFLQDDLSIRLVEWIELLGLLGADKIFLYQLEVHPNISKVLDYYQAQGKIQLTPITLPGEQPNIPGLRHMYLKSKVTSKRQNEVIPYNDCLYRNLYTYDYIALMDTDEVILPKQLPSWNELIDDIVPKALAKSDSNRIVSSYNFRNVYFWDNVDLDHSTDHVHQSDASIPGHMHMLQHVQRSANYTKPNQYVKCFHDVQKILTLHNHFPLSCLKGACKSYAVDPETAHLQHYRADCVSTLKKSCDSEFKQHLVKDTAIWRYKDDLIPRVNDVLRKLRFIN